ncbi:T9SS type A sorting domain-containing protein [Chitinophaga barathri]|nr:T9SS type A sorting domain-containing protein [Chitinophaga barathri]
MKHCSTRLLLMAIFLAMAWMPAQAQLVLVREVVASSGGTGTAGNIQLDYTIGEPAVITLSAGNITLSQGFHQPEVIPKPPQGANPILDFMLFPNPALTTVRISFNLLTDATVVFMLMNTSGQVIFQEVKQYGAGKITIPTPVDKLASGIYTVIFKVNGHVFTEKLIVQ